MDKIDVNLLYDGIGRYLDTLPLYPEDKKDIESEAVEKLYRYIPEKFDSNLHQKRWLKIYCKRYAINSLRNFFANKKFRPFVGLLDDSIEKESCSEYFRKINIPFIQNKVAKYFNDDTIEKKAVLEKLRSGYGSVKKIADKYNITYRTLLNWEKKHIKIIKDGIRL